MSVMEKENVKLVLTKHEITRIVNTLKDEAIEDRKIAKSEKRKLLKRYFLGRARANDRIANKLGRLI